MKFVEQHLTKHHFFHAPHRWFLAVLLSPIHAAEVHYQKHYHLKFAHARKLFFFDMMLVAMVFAMAGSWGYIHFYDPTVTKDITTTLSASSDKIKNGEYIKFVFNYKNTSKQILKNSTISFDVPTGFVIQETTPSEIYQKQTRTFVLPTLPPGAGGQVEIGGWLYNNTDEKVFTAAHFAYKQDGRNEVEQKVSSIFVTPRDSVLTVALDAPKELVNGGTSNVGVTLTNNGNKTLTNISVQLGLPNGEVVATDGSNIEKNIWTLNKPIEPKQSVSLPFTFTPNNLTSETPATLSVTPQIKINNSTFVFARTVSQSATVFAPHVLFGAQFEKKENVMPGKTIAATLVIKNNGNIILTNGVVTIPVSNFIDTKRLAELNRGTLDKTGLHITSKHSANLLEIAPGQEISVPVVVPVKYTLDGTDVSIKLQPIFSSGLKNIGGTFTQTASTQEIKVGTALTLDASVKYFTVEGDQLGRGPLPPRVGKETKYAAVVHVANGSSSAENFHFTATLPPHMHWTGRTSVSAGKEPTFDALSGQISWNVLTLRAHQEATLFMELSLTPDASQVGTTPVVLKNISASATDTFIDAPVRAQFRDLDTSLPSDPIGKIKGVTVKE